MFPIFKKAFKHGLNEEDLFEPLDEHKSCLIGDKLERIWKNEFRKNEKTALHWALFKCFGFDFLVYSFLRDLVEITLMYIHNAQRENEIVAR